MTYETIAHLSQTGGLIYFVLLFFGVCAYAMWPKNRDRFDRAAHMPLDEED